MRVNCLLIGTQQEKMILNQITLIVVFKATHYVAVIISYFTKLILTPFTLSLGKFEQNEGETFS